MVKMKTDHELETVRTEAVRPFCHISAGKEGHKISLNPL
jgi:hypothetical protein